MHAQARTGRIVLIDDGNLGEDIAHALTSAGYEIEHSRDEGRLAGAEVVVRVTSRRSSSVVGRREDAEVPACRERARELHEQKVRLEAVARLAGGVAHNLNNILSVISICADEVLETMTHGDSSHACLLDIRHAVERGASLSRDLLSFSRRDLMEPRLLDFNELVTAAAGMLEQVVGRDVVVRTELTAADAWVNVDASQWASVFMNLALNARAAMPDGGSLSLSTRVHELDPSDHGVAGPKGRFVELEVTDTGRGMSHEILTHIFEPFFTGKGMGNGIGLGLSVVHGVVEQSGGWIQVESDIDRGTTFKLFVPAGESPPQASAARPVVTPAPREATVLLVEDEPAVRRVAVRSLERQGYSVLQAGSAEEALSLVADSTTPVDLLVTDVVLPGMNGRRFASLLLEQRPGLPVLYTSGYTDDEVLRLGVTQSELSFLQKPYTIKALVARIDAMLACSAEASRPAPST